MNTKKVLIYPNSKLNEVATPITSVKDAEEIEQEMKETLNNYPTALGLAANQIAVTKRIILVTIDNQWVTMVNPDIMQKEGIQYLTEGCLSVPKFFATVKRFSDITVKFQKTDLKDFHTLSLTGIEASEIQHEVDHLNGIEFVQRLSKIKHRDFIKKYKRIQKHMKKGLI